VSGSRPSLASFAAGSTSCASGFVPKRFAISAYAAGAPGTSTIFPLAVFPSCQRRAGHAGLAQRAHHLPHVAAQLDVDARRGLVEEGDLRLV